MRWLALLGLSIGEVFFGLGGRREERGNVAEILTKNKRTIDFLVDGIDVSKG